MDPGTAGILVAEGAALAAILAAYSLGRDATTTTTAGVPEPKAASPPPPPGSAPAPPAPGSAAATVTVPDATEDPTIEADPDVTRAKEALQAKKREFETKKITRESELLTELDKGKPGTPGAPASTPDAWKAWKATRPIKERELRLGFEHADEDNAVVLKGLQKALDDARAAAVKAKAETTTATTIPEQPPGAVPAEALKFNASAAVAAAPGDGKPGAESPPGLPRPTELEKGGFTTAVKLAMENKFENLQPAIDLADKTPSLLADTYEDDPFLVWFMKKVIHAAVQNKLRWRLNVRTDQAGVKAYRMGKAVASTGRGRIRTPRRIRGGAWTTELRALILKTLNVLKDRGNTDPKELTPIMTAFLLLIADYGDTPNKNIYNNLVDIFTLFIDYKGYADRWRTYLLRMNSPDRKLVADVMFATALKVADIKALNSNFFWARSGLRNSWGDAVAVKFKDQVLTKRSNWTSTQGVEDNTTTEALNAGAQTVLTGIKEAAARETDTDPMRAANAALEEAKAPPAAAGVSLLAASSSSAAAVPGAGVGLSTAAASAAVTAAAEERDRALTAAADAAEERDRALRAAADAAAGAAGLRAEAASLNRDLAAARGAAAAAKMELADVRAAAAAAAAAAASGAPGAALVLAPSPPAAAASGAPAPALASAAPAPALAAEEAPAPALAAAASSAAAAAPAAEEAPAPAAPSGVAPEADVGFNVAGIPRARRDLDDDPIAAMEAIDARDAAAAAAAAAAAPDAEFEFADIFDSVTNTARSIKSVALKKIAERIIAGAKKVLGTTPENLKPGVKSTMTKALNAAKDQLEAFKQSTEILPSRLAAAALGRQSKEQAAAAASAAAANEDAQSVEVPGATVDEEAITRRGSLASLSSVAINLLRDTDLTAKEQSDLSVIPPGDTDIGKLFSIYATFEKLSDTIQAEKTEIVGRVLLGGRRRHRRRSHRRKHRGRRARTSTFRRNRKH